MGKLKEMLFFAVFILTAAAADAGEKEDRVYLSAYLGGGFMLPQFQGSIRSEYPVCNIGSCAGVLAGYRFNEYISLLSGVEYEYDYYSLKMKNDMMGDIYLFQDVKTYAGSRFFFAEYIYLEAGGFYSFKIGSSGKIMADPTVQSSSKRYNNYGYFLGGGVVVDYDSRTSVDAGIRYSQGIPVMYRETLTDSFEGTTVEGEIITREMEIIGSMTYWLQI